MNEELIEINGQMYPKDIICLGYKNAAYEYGKYANKISRFHLERVAYLKDFISPPFECVKFKEYNLDGNLITDAYMRLINLTNMNYVSIKTYEKLKAFI